MLTLERKEGESIVIYNDDLEIEVVVKTSKNGRAKIQIDAPDEFQIMRKELTSSNDA